MSPSSAAATKSEAWPVLLACSDEVRLAALRQALARWPVPAQPSVVSSTVPALRRALMQPGRLVVVDWQLDGRRGQALVQELARLLPALPVLAFDRQTVHGAGGQVLAWPWDELPAVLDRWLQQAREGEVGVEGQA